MHNTQVETIGYAYPDLGYVEINLRKESADIYKFIRKEGGGIEYFETLDQLGALRAVHKSAHHSRWEYMMLQMHLIQQLKANSAFGFSTSIDLTSQHSVSSLEELLKSWVLLNNFGHLLDTFEAERVWLELILENPNLYQVLISCMYDQRCRDLAENICKEEDLYHFHHLIALSLLGRLSQKRSKSEALIDLSIEMLKALLSDMIETLKPEEGSKLGRALSVFYTLRRVSYVLLDINRSTLFLRIDSNNLLRNILEKPDAILYDPESEVNKTLEDMERLLFSEVYASQQACIFKYHYIAGQKRNFAKIVSKNGIGIFCKNHKIFATQLHQAKINNFGKYKPNVKKRHLCRLNLLPSFPFERSVCHFYTEQKKLHSKVNMNVDFLITATHYSEAGSIIDTFVTGKLDAQGLSAIYYALGEYIIECYDEWSVDEEPFGYAISTPLQELFSQILQAFTDSTLKIRFPAGASPSDYHVDVIKSNKNRARWARSFSHDIEEAKLSPARDWELRALLQLLRRRKGGLFLVAVSNIHLYNPDGTRKVEWDGAFLELEKDNITLYILEAKKGESRRSRKCSLALLDSTNKAGIRPKQGKFAAVPCKGYAYTKIALQDIIAIPSE